MPAVFLPCPSCATPLILDEENVGLEVLCPRCASHLRLPPTLDPTGQLTLLPPTTEPTTEPTTKSLLPQGRRKSAQDEITRLAAAAAAAGGANSFHPQEVTLPTDHRRTPIPSRRAPDAPLPPNLQPTPLQPIEPRADLDLGSPPLRGPSRFVQPEPAPAPPNPSEAESNEESAARGGFRLGEERRLHFSPVPTAEVGGDATTWGSKPESPDEAARSRRFISLALLLVLLAAGGVGAYTFRQAFLAPKPTTDPSQTSSPAAARSQEDVMRNVRDARLVLQRFLAAESVEALAAEVRHPEITHPRMARPYANLPLKPLKIRNESQSWSEIRFGENDFIRAGIELSDFRTYLFTFQLIPNGEPKVDWESFANWAELPWKDFLKSPPDQAIDYRVILSHDPKDQYYNYAFQGKEAEMLCFKVEDPEKFASCWAYCPKHSTAAAPILFYLEHTRRQITHNIEGKLATPCILRLRFPPEGKTTNQVLIEAFLQPGWIEP